MKSITIGHRLHKCFALIKLNAWHKSTVALMMLLFVLPSSVFASITQPTNTLNSINSEHFDSFMVADAAELPMVKKIFIEESKVSFDRDWLKKFRFATHKRYRESIQKKYSKMLTSQLKDSLVDAGWTVVDKPQDDALTVIAQFKDLHITAPDTVNRQNKLVYSVGKVAISLEVKGTDDQLFFALEDYGNAGGITGSLFETERALNYSIFNRLASKWANNFVVYLDLSMDALAQERS